MGTLAPEAFRLGPLTPKRAVAPRDAAEVAAVLAEAASSGLAVVPWGGGTHQGLGRSPLRYDLALSLGHLDALIDHQPGDLTVTVQAGATLAAVQAALARHGQYLPLEAESPERATIGGLLAANVSGPLRFGHGTARDALLWVEAARPDGTLVRGGAKVVKNVAGYDVPKLLVGSFGSLGVITAAAFKVQPLPERHLSAALGFYALEAAEELLIELGSGRLGASMLTLLRGEAEWGAPFDLAPYVVLVGLDGPAGTTAWQEDRLLTLGRAAHMSGALVFEGDAAADVRRAAMARRLEGPLALKLSVSPGQLPGLAAHVALTSEDPWLFAEAGNGVLRCAWARPTDAWREAAAMAADLGGAWALERCPDAWRAMDLAVWGPERPDWALMKRIKAALDPLGTLSPGRTPAG